MGFLDEFWKDMDKPAFIFRYHKTDDKLEEENRKLRLIIKKLLEQGIRVDKIGHNDKHYLP